MSTPSFELDGEFEVLPDLGCVRRADGDEIAMRPKTFQALLYLVRNRQRLVTKEELTTLLWPETAVTDDALVQCIVEMRKALGDQAREPRFVRTVPKLGYRFIAQVSETGAEAAEVAPSVAEFVAAPPIDESAASSVHGARSWWPALITLTAALLIGVGVLMSGGTRTATAGLDPASGKPGIAVMFLDNQSRTAEIDWMRQGLAEMLITGLSRSERVNVLGRKHLQTLLGRLNHPEDREITLDTARDVARRAQAQFLLTGSFARLGDKTRIDVRIETVDAKQVASETLTVDRAEDILTQVDLLAWKLATYFDSGVQRPADVAASGLTTDLDAYRAYSLGLSKAIAYHSDEAIKLFERALELDPNFVMARARLGYVYGVTWPQPGVALPHLEAAFQHADRLRESDRLYIEAWHAIARSDFAGAISPLQRIVRLYPYELEAYDRLARLLMGERRLDEGIEVSRRGLLIDPESSDLHNTLGGLYAMAGRYADAIATHRRYVALAPTEPNAHDSLGLSFQVAGRYEEAEAAYNRALELKPDFEVALAHLANVHFQTGRYRKAEQLYERYTSLARNAAERARGQTCVTVIRVRHGRLTEAMVSASASDRHTELYSPGAPRWGSLARLAMMGAPLEQLPSREKFAALSDRGSRTSKRWFLWLAGRDALARGNTESGLDLLRQVMLENPVHWSIDPMDEALGVAFVELKRWDDAIAELQRVLRVNPRYPRAHYFLSLAYEGKGDVGAARDALRQFLSVWSGADDDIPELVDARARLARLQS